MTKSRFMLMYAKEYLRYRRTLGFVAEESDSYEISFARFMDSHAPQILPNEMWLMQWAKAGSGASINNRLSRLRRFTAWMAMHNPEISISDSFFSGRKENWRKEPYIYSEEEVKALIATARKRQNRRNRQPHNHACLLGLLSATGLRVGEALRLDDEDIDWHDGLLHVRNSKNLPWRMVPLHPSVLDALNKHIADRNNEHPHRLERALFVSLNGNRVSYGAVFKAFSKCKRDAGIPFRTHWRAPRIHDFRHTFACQYLLKQYRNKCDVYNAVSDLSVYLGHATAANTYHYLSAIPELMAICGERFRLQVNRHRGGCA